MAANSPELDTELPTEISQQSPESDNKNKCNISDDTVFTNVKGNDNFNSNETVESRSCKQESRPKETVENARGSQEAYTTHSKSRRKNQQQRGQYFSSQKDQQQENRDSGVSGPRQHQWSPQAHSVPSQGDGRYGYNSKQAEDQHHRNRTPTSGRNKYHSRKHDRVGSGRGAVDTDTKLSKRLSYLLRHGAEKEGFKLMEGGFLYVKDLLENQQLKTYTVSDVERVVHNNEKKRFHLENDDNGQLKIRANQGHSLKVEGLEMTEITSAEEFPVVVHGTYWKYLESIKSKGLSKSKRNHIHCAPGVPGEDDVTSGMRANCDTIIYIDLDSALKDGLKFFKSANNVILAEGNGEGFLLPKYFQKVVNRKTEYHKVHMGGAIVNSMLNSKHSVNVV